jgi:hypothetical protein
MTTGCNCATPGCRGIVPAPGLECGRCEINALPPGPERAIRTLAYQLLYGGEPDPSGMFGPCDREAES